MHQRVAVVFCCVVFACAPTPAVPTTIDVAHATTDEDAGTTVGTATSVDAGRGRCAFSDVGPLPEVLNELSGLAVGRLHTDVIYAHNDSGDSARFFALSKTDAHLLAEFKVGNASAVDWEDIAVGPCATFQASACVYLADIGDNNAKRDQVVIYELIEPELNAKNLSATAHTFAYPDGAQNAETLLVHPQNGEVYVVSKSFGGSSKVYNIKLKGQGSTAALAGSVLLPGGPLALVTGGDIASDAKHVALRTYGALYEYAWPLVAGATPAELQGPTESQGEAVAYSPDGATLYTASEGKKQALHATRCIRP